MHNWSFCRKLSSAFLCCLYNRLSLPSLRKDTCLLLFFLSTILIWNQPLFWSKMRCGESLKLISSPSKVKPMNLNCPPFNKPPTAIIYIILWVSSIVYFSYYIWGRWNHFKFKKGQILTLFWHLFFGIGDPSFTPSREKFPKVSVFVDVLLLNVLGCNLLNLRICECCCCNLILKFVLFKCE